MLIPSTWVLWNAVHVEQWLVMLYSMFKTVAAVFLPYPQTTLLDLLYLAIFFATVSITHMNLYHRSPRNETDCP